MPLCRTLGDKIIIFSDDVFALKKYATALNVPFIYGGTKESDRSKILHGFRSSSVTNTIAISKVRCRTVRCGAVRYGE